MATGTSGKGLISNVGGDHQSYLGHFRSGEIIKRGHNFGLRDVTGALKDSIGMGGSDGGSKPHRPTKKQLGNEAWRASHKVASARADVRAAKKTGNESAVAAAKEAKRGVVAEKKDALKTVRGAQKAVRQSAGEGGGVQRVAKQALKTARATAGQSFKGALQKQDARQAARKRAKSSGGGLFSKVSPF